MACEVKKAINTQKSYKAPGDDKITNELLKELFDVILNTLTQVFNEILNNEHIPTQWTGSTIVLIHKKEDKNKIDNYRPICMMTNLYKIFSKILLGRITKCLDEQQPIEQAGFRSEFSTVDHIHVVKQVIEKYNEYGKSYYILFVDYNKAFDSLYHSSIYNALKKQGVHTKYINMIRQIYNRSTARIQLEKVGEEFKIEKGVRQGDPLSPKLFAAVLEGVFRELQWDNLGLNINGKRLNHLRFADDIVLFSEEPQVLQRMLQQLSDASAEVGLTINFSKTKVITNSTQVAIKITEQEIEYVEEYIYLGHLISPHHLMSKEIQRRVNNTWSRYWSLKEVVKSKSIPIREKKKVYDSCILPVLTYGCQTWSLTKLSMQKLKVCQQGMERSMLGIRIRDKCRLVDIRKQTGVADVANRVRRLKWRWTGHTMRTRIEKWTRRVTEWYPRAAQEVGRRPTTGVEEVDTESRGLARPGGGLCQRDNLTKTKHYLS